MQGFKDGCLGSVRVVVFALLFPEKIDINSSVAA